MLNYMYLDNNLNTKPYVVRQRYGFFWYCNDNSNNSNDDGDGEMMMIIEINWWLQVKNQKCRNKFICSHTFDL